MQFNMVSILAFAAAVAALPNSYPGQSQTQNSITIDEAKANCPAGEVACCQNSEDLQADGVLGNLLGKGLLNNLLGTGDSSCAKFSLIENLNILGMLYSGLKERPYN